jgi:hypothetical protein
MGSALGIKNTAFTLSTPGVVAAAMLGGTPLNPIAPTVTQVFAGVPATSRFYPDFQETYAYVTDANGDIYQCNLMAGGSAQIYSIGTNRILGMEVSPDGTYLLVCLNNNTVVKILTASPYTVTVYLGTAGTSSRTDGTGTGATISGGGPMWYSEDKTLLYLQDSGVLRKITIATGAIATLNTLALPGGNAFDLGYSGAVYGGNNGVMTKTVIASSISALIATIGGYTSTNFQYMPDTRQPTERCVYAVNSFDAKLWRYDFTAAAWTTIATLAASNPAVALSRGARWNNNHIITLAGSNIYKIA